VDRKKLDGAAAALRIRFPDWTKKRIAEELGVTASVLSDTRRPLPAFNAASEQVAAERSERAEKLGAVERRASLPDANPDDL
jgi:hypothetical protein